MKICWDNLDKIKYRPDRGEWQYKKHFYIYKESCKNCSEPFLAHSIFCDYSCSVSGKNHSMFGKQHSEKSKKKMREAHKNRKYYYVIENNISLYDTYANQISFCEEVKRNKEDSNILEVKCAYCGKWFIPKMTDVCDRIKALNGKGSSGQESRFYCSIKCKKECPIYRKILYPKGFKPATSREVQPELRQMCFGRDNYTCQKCGKHQDELKVGLNCHHIEGIRWEPLESADLDKVITFCKDCHIEVHKQPDCGYHDMMCK